MTELIGKIFNFTEIMNILKNEETNTTGTIGLSDNNKDNGNLIYSARTMTDNVISDYHYDIYVDTVTNAITNVIYISSSEGLELAKHNENVLDATIGKPLDQIALQADLRAYDGYHIMITGNNSIIDRQTDDINRRIRFYVHFVQDSKNMIDLDAWAYEIQCNLMDDGTTIVTGYYK